MVPVTFVLFVLDDLRKDDFYPRRGLWANPAIAAIYFALALVSAKYMHVEFYYIIAVRASFWNTTDMVMGAIMVRSSWNTRAYRR